MGKYSVPESVRIFKPKGTMVKRINDKNFYVYEYKSVTENGKRSTKMGKLVGKIIPNVGFIPNDSFIVDEEITTLEFGQYKFAISNSLSTYKLLTEVFNLEEAGMIYSMAIISLINNLTYLKNYNKYYEQSILNLEFPNLKMGYTSLANLLDNLGRRQGKVHEFEQKLVDSSSKKIAIDGHVISSYSNENNLAEYGNKYSKVGSMQVNLMMAYDIKNNRPLSSKFYSGSSLDKTSVQDFIENCNYFDVLFIIDRGFYSEENIELFIKNNNNYIVPLSVNLKSYKQVTQSMDLTSTFVYKTPDRDKVIEYKEELVDDKRIIVFKDLDQNMAEKADYLDNLKKGEKGFSQEKFEELKNFFGVIVLQTSLSSQSAEEIFCYYKKRWKIETFYNVLKNRVDLNTLYEQDYYKMQGLAFISLIIGLIHKELGEQKKFFKGMSLSEIFLELRFLKINKKSDKWYIQNVKSKLRELMSQLNCPITKEYTRTYL